MGQYTVVVPQEDLVVVILGMKLYGHQELACIWNQLMPGLRAQALKPEKKLQQKLEKLCAGASLQLPQGKKRSSRGGQFVRIDSNRHGFRYLSVAGDELVRTDPVSGRQDTLDLGYGRWAYSPMNGYPVYSINAINMMQGLGDDFVAAAACAWTSPTTLEVRIHYVNWISGTTLVFDFDSQEVAIVDTYPNSKPEVVGFNIE